MRRGPVLRNQIQEGWTHAFIVQLSGVTTMVNAWLTSYGELHDLRHKQRSHQDLPYRRLHENEHGAECAGKSAGDRSHLRDFYEMSSQNTTSWDLCASGPQDEQSPPDANRFASACGADMGNLNRRRQICTMMNN
jgi:hypothetical protein